MLSSFLSVSRPSITRHLGCPSYRRKLSKSSTTNPLPATFIRGGTSKGIFINAAHLPPSRAEWPNIFLGIMGSPDPEHGRQLNGMGGGVSSLSKIMVVGPPSPDRAAQGIDAEYTFAQVGIRDSEIDYSGNCGNLSSVVGVFAVDEGICSAQQSVSPITWGTLGTVRLWNTNTNKVIHTTFPLTGSSQPKLDTEEVSIAGVPGQASKIVLDFVNPAGARTGKLLPTGTATHQASVKLETGETLECTISLVDATNPTVFVSSQDIFGTEHLPSETLYKDEALLRKIESIRRAGAEAMGLDPSAQAQPKIAVLGVPSQEPTPDGIPVDIDVQAMSMGVLHRAVPMTLGLCLGVAASVEGSIANRISAQARSNRFKPDAERAQQGLVRLRHPSGIVDVGAEFGPDGTVKSAKVIRTGRRLMKGDVWW
ncbi:hypothetical protein M422DRAFT_32891 [Sphaerobolus stellatus SS14]|uniref:DUF453-domain-containing protein n=1 Tax=Sphaerobolus stellatus (strain SS14) TaxID=990650 RepID=A0A0C9VMV9_SPHS4|nr:hypothetical protein M422DRAFT_32891 [Sphaerobolus stellatus SS14]